MSKRIDYKAIRAKIKEHCDRDIVRELLHIQGVEVRNDYRFKDNDSFSIDKNGTIKDFGSTDFSGDIVSFMVDILGMEPKDAAEWVGRSLGVWDE